MHFLGHNELMVGCLAHLYEIKQAYDASSYKAFAHEVNISLAIFCVNKTCFMREIMGEGIENVNKTLLKNVVTEFL